MTKNNLRYDVVLHLKNMMLTWCKRSLPTVGLACISDASSLLNDGSASFCMSFLPEKQAKPIKLILVDKEML